MLPVQRVAHIMLQGIFLERGSPITHTYCGSDERHSLHGGEWLHLEPCIDHTFFNFNVEANANQSVGSRLCSTPAFILSSLRPAFLWPITYIYIHQRWFFDELYF